MTTTTRLRRLPRAVSSVAIHAFRQDHGHAGVHPDALKVGNLVQRVQQVLEPVLGQDQWVAAAEDDLPQCRDRQPMACRAPASCFRPGRLLGIGKFAPETIPAVDRHRRRW